MAFQLRPVSDDKFEWTAASGVNGWAMLDQPVNEPNSTNPAEYITTATVNKIARFNVETPPALPAGAHVTRVTAWAAVNVPSGSSISFGLFTNVSGYSAVLEQFDGPLLTYLSKTVAPGDTGQPASLDDLSVWKLQVISPVVAGGAMFVFSSYIHVDITLPKTGVVASVPMRLG